MATLFLKVTNQSLEASLDIPKIVENSINYLTIHKEYTSDWEGLAIKYLFTCEEETYEWFNDDVPDYVIKSPGFVVSMVGFTENDNGIITERITTNPVPVYVYSSGKINGKTLSDEEVRAKLIDVFAATVQETKRTAEMASATADGASATASEAKETANSASATANEAKKIADLTKSAHDTLSEKANDFANAIKGKKEGSLIVIDDISPIEHNVKVKANGKNLFNCLRAPIQQPKDNIAYISAVTENSITITSKETSTGNGYTHFGSIKIKEFLPQLEVGKTYVLSANSDANIKAIYIPGISFLWKFNEPLTITNEVLNSGLAMYGYHPTYDGFGDCVISNIQIEEGKIATEYEPYIDPTTVNVIGCGKNLIPFGQGDYVSGKTKTVNGVTFTVNDDGSIKVSGTATPNNAAFTLYAPQIVKAGEQTVTLSGISQEEKKCYLALVSESKTYYHYGNEIYNVTAQNVDIANSRITFVVIKDKTIDTTIYPQIEFGEAKTGFESPIVYNSATPNADGTCDVKSVSPFMQIFTDTSGVTIDCEYNRDMGKVIDNAIKENNGIKYIRESVEAHQLEDGIYIIDELNGGSVYFASDKFSETFDYNDLYRGVIIVSNDESLTAKQIVVFSRDNSFYIPKIFVTYITEEGTFVDESTDAFMPKSYIDEQVKITNNKIKEINGLKCITEEVDANELDYGVYTLDEENGVVHLPDREIYSGMIFVSNNVDCGKQMLVLDGLDDYGVPKLEIFPMSSNSNEYNGIPDAYASISYVDAISNSIPLETLYRFNYAELDSSILSKTIEPTTRYDVSTLRITFKLKVANVNTDGTITPYFNLPIKYMSNPTLMMDSYIKNIADFKSFALKSPLLSADFKSFEEMTTKLLNQGIARSSDIRIVSEYDNGEISILTVWFLSFSSDAARDDAIQQTITPVIDSVTDFALKYEKHQVNTVKPKLLNH